ncbi:MAG TPA: hypothetical protein VF590_14745, partial [Isosphaeraceae bacterium]
QRRRLAELWGLDEQEAFGDAEDASASPPTEAEADADADAATGDYDRAQWQKKMKRILEELPGSREQWGPLMAEARALGFDGPWMYRAQIEEFTLLVRRAVADGVFTEKEHQTLDLARDLMGLPEAEAESLVHGIVTEAETFFGKHIEGA